MKKAIRLALVLAFALVASAPVTIKTAHASATTRDYPFPTCLPCPPVSAQ
jgi:hypothetical protein